MVTMPVRVSPPPAAEGATTFSHLRHLDGDHAGKRCPHDGVVFVALGERHCSLWATSKVGAGRVIGDAAEFSSASVEIALFL